MLSDNALLLDKNSPQGGGKSNSNYVIILVLGLLSHSSFSLYWGSTEKGFSGRFKLNLKQTSEGRSAAFQLTRMIELDTHFFGKTVV